MRNVPLSLLFSAAVSLVAVPTGAQTDAPAPAPGIQPGGPLGAPIGGGSVVPPALEILGFNSVPAGNLCDTSGGTAALLLDVAATGYGGDDYDCYNLTVAGVGQVSLPFCETPGPLPDGNYIYGMQAEASYTVAPGTLLTARILTYAGGAQTGSGRLNHVATAVFPCDNPASATITNENVSTQSIPALGALGLLALVVALGGLSIFALRRRRSAHS